MEIEQPQTTGVFSQICVKDINAIKAEKTVFQACFSSPNISQHLDLTITENHVVLNLTHDGPIMAVRLSYALKFQMIFKINEDVKSSKVGFKLMIDSHTENTFKTNDIRDLMAVEHLLAQRINQRGFHHSFKPIKKLGKGGFATVYEAIRLIDSKRFAIKAFSKAIFADSQKGGIESLQNQLNVLRHLKHKNILHLESVYESENSIYVIMELLEGKSMQEVIKQKKGEFSLEQIKEIMSGLFKGLVETNQNRIMHRDLKPDNIMFRKQGSYQPVIVDFGLSTFCDISKYLFHRCGTPGYVAPEVLASSQNTRIQPVCDIFSLGCIFHILLTGYPIFPGTQYADVYRKNKNLQLVMKVSRVQEKSPAALDLLTKMLQEHPNHRISASNALKHHFFKIGN